jgi:hypothetical protein
MQHSQDFNNPEFKFDSLTLSEVEVALGELSPQLIIEVEDGKKTKAARARARKLTLLLEKGYKAYRKLSIKA